MKKYLSILLTCLVLFCLCLQINIVKAGSTIIESTAQDAGAINTEIENATNGQTIKLNHDVVLSGNQAGNVSIPSGKTITIDLNGYGLVQGQTRYHSTIYNLGNLTIIDSSPTGSGYIEPGYGQTVYGLGGAIYNMGTCVMKGGTITTKGTGINLYSNDDFQNYNGLCVYNVGTFVMEGNAAIKDLKFVFTWVKPNEQYWNKFVRGAIISNYNYQAKATLKDNVVIDNIELYWSDKTCTNVGGHGWFYNEGTMDIEGNVKIGKLINNYGHNVELLTFQTSGYDARTNLKGGFYHEDPTSYVSYGYQAKSTDSKDPVDTTYYPHKVVCTGPYAVMEIGSYSESMVYGSTLATAQMNYGLFGGKISIKSTYFIINSKKQSIKSDNIECTIEDEYIDVRFMVYGLPAGTHKLGMVISDGKTTKESTCEFTITKRSTNSVNLYIFNEKATAIADAGKPVLTYSTEYDGEYTTKEPTKKGTYYVKATVEETDSYVGAEAGPEVLVLTKDVKASNGCSTHWGIIITAILLLLSYVITYLFLGNMPRNKRTKKEYQSVFKKENKLTIFIDKIFKWVYNLSQARLAFLIISILSFILWWIFVFSPKCWFCVILLIFWFIIGSLLTIAIFFKKEMKDVTKKVTDKIGNEKLTNAVDKASSIESSIEEAISLSDGIMITESVTNVVINKKSIAEYIESLDNTIVNRRDNYVNKTKLPLPDTHYINVSKEGSKNSKKCFIYVYELNDNKVFMLLKINTNTLKEHLKDNKQVYTSRFPVGNGWTYLGVDSNMTLNEVKEIILFVMNNN